MTTDPVLRLDRSEGWDRAVAAALDHLLSRRGERVRASEIWAAIRRRENLRLMVSARDGTEVDRTDDRASQIAEVRFVMTALYRRAKLVDSGEPAGEVPDPEYQVLK